MGKAVLSNQSLILYLRVDCCFRIIYTQMEMYGRMNEMERKYVWHGRTYRRFELQFPVRIRFQSGATRLEVEGVSKNVSVGGLLVRSTVAIPPHTAVSFVLSLHGSDAVRPIHIRGEGSVVRVWEHAGIYLLAVKCREPVVHLEDFLKEGDDMELMGHNPS